MSKWIDVVDEDGTLLLSIQTHWLPDNLTPEQAIVKILPALSLLYGYKCYYTDKEMELWTVH